MTRLQGPYKSTYSNIVLVYRSRSSIKVNNGLLFGKMYDPHANHLKVLKIQQEITSLNKHLISLQIRKNNIVELGLAAVARLYKQP